MEQRLIALLALCSASALAMDCQVLSVHDGDTLTANCGAGKIHVRLTEIDAPERTQPYSRMSTNSLKGMCMGAHTSIESAGVDKYGRTLGRVTCNNVDANREQVRRGYAWAFDKYLTDRTIKAAETEARGARRGLWRSSDPENPADYRARKRQEQPK